LEDFVSPIDRAHIHIEIPGNFHCDEIAVGVERNFVVFKGDIEFLAKEIAGQSQNLPGPPLVSLGRIGQLGSLHGVGWVFFSSC
jgi:hypothetical protein